MAQLGGLDEHGRIAARTLPRRLIGAPKSELKKFACALAAADGWRTVQDGVEVKLARHPETGETAILCRSADRCAKPIFDTCLVEKFGKALI